MKKFYSFSALALSVLAVSGCFGTKQLSHDITKEGTVQTDNIRFPELNKAWQKDGQFPNTENLSKIRPGVGKDELYQLIGRPHFSEAQKAREWDYIMKFYQEDDSVRVCQYKVIFDKDYKGQEFYWKPADCAEFAKVKKPEPTIIYQQVPAPAPLPMPQQPIISEKITLSADALFYFDKWKEQDMLPKGRPELDALARKLVEYQSRGRTQIQLVGHTDLLGEDMYNMNLSQLRAQTVRSYLINRGVEAASLMASGAGETQPVKSCNMNQPRKALIDCLQPNRRVELQVSVYAYENVGGQTQPVVYDPAQGMPVNYTPAPVNLQPINQAPSNDGFN